MISAFKQKLFFRAFLILSLVLFFMVFVYAYRTEVTQDLPSGVAPFFEEYVGSSSGKQPQSQNLNKSHRTIKELQTWLSLAISESLMLDSRDYERQLATARGYFSEDGYAAFQAYLQQAKLRETLQNNNLKVSVIVEQPPLLLNEGVVGQSYRWLFQMPVTISYLSRNATEYRPGDRTSARQLTIRAQIGRYGAAADENGLKIESFKVLPRRD